MTEDFKRSSTFEIMAMLFASIAKEVTERFGEAGKEAIAEGVRKFGEARGRTIAQNTINAGKELTLENYLKYYDMERSKEFESETKVTDTNIDQKITKCPFGQTWKALGVEDLGKLYCNYVDAALAKGYNPKIKYNLAKHVLRGDDYCHLLFSLDAEKEK